ncbi:MAG: glycosyltransferase [Candidatus Omnitrophica bacterium]|nr:glycosyltransferase [Candidatus Omnitrophota bacterium]
MKANKKPKLLIVLSYPICPPDGGGRLLTWNVLRSLSRFFEVHALLRRPFEEHHVQGLSDLREYCTLHIAGYPPSGLFWSILSRLRSIFGRYPISDISHFYMLPDSLRLIRADFDIIQVEHAWAYHDVLKQRKAALVIMAHNWEYEYWRNHGLSLIRCGNFLYGIFVYFGSIKLLFQERLALLDADLVLGVSKQECVKIERAYPVAGKLFDMAFGLRIADYVPFLKVSKGVSAGGVIRLVYVGSLDSPQSEDAINFFIEAIAPVLRRSGCNFLFDVVGRGPSAKLKSRIKDIADVRLIGFVQDVRPHIMDSDVVVVPLRYGAGMRIKIIEAMAMGKPIVSTRKGAEGVVIDGSGTVLADSPEAFAEAIIRIAGDPKLCCDAGQKNLAVANRYYDWEKNFDKYVLPHYLRLIDQESSMTANQSRT